ncbi:hypothetical protein KJ657_02425 [Patescibacteria group bacterium]|nr:hypothetical protein [Patescibacteria group bacterium]MBU1015922.1 hypothetical protein [Patescibacteria group bacterium]MBU1685091.1 hypothetical protein [Patescibacteria group bacterium]MBU1938146.1 hypothetical protein [Patescibacteria group bacterium]
MHKIKRNFIIGLAVLIGLGIQAQSVFALYSPRLSQQVVVIRQHVQGSQEQNGTQSILEEVEQIKAYDKAKRAESRETGIAGDAKVAQGLVFDTTFASLIQFPLDSIFMIFNYNAYNEEWISNCLRDEIWNLETLRDKVGSEMIKAYLLRDTYHGSLLMQDYDYLVTQLDLLRRYGSDPKAKIEATLDGKAVTINSNKYFFGEDPKGNPPLNYYSNVGVFSSSDATGCPDGEFEKAIEEVLNSWETLKGTVGGHSAFSAEKWSNIYAMAKANARAKAREWIRANQISLTIAGKEGGNPQSVIKGGGTDKFVGYWKTQWNILKNMVGVVTPFYDAATNYQPPSDTEDVGTNCRFFNQADGYFRVCNKEQIEQYEKCQDEEMTKEESGIIKCDRFRNAAETISYADKINRQLALEREHETALEDVETAFTYSMSMDSVAEETIYFMDDVLWDMNNQIKRGYKAVNKAAGEGIPTLYREVEKLAAKQCANKQK